MAPMAGSALVMLLAIGPFAAALGGAQPAAMVVRLDNAELVARSQVVIYGRVLSVESGDRISEAVVAVECALKGAPGPRVSVEFSPGLAESPVFEPGELVLLFLTETGARRFQATGGEQGKVPFGK